MGIDIRNSEGYVDVVPFKAIQNIDSEEKAAVKPAFLPLVYICAPYSGDTEANTKKAMEFAEFAYGQGNIPLAAHVLFPFIDDTDAEEREKVIRMDIVLMGKCQEVWVLSDVISAGMQAEIDKANKRRQKVRYFNRNFEEVVQK